MIKIYTAKNFDFILKKYNPRRDKKENFFDISKNKNILLTAPISWNNVLFFINFLIIKDSQDETRNLYFFYYWYN